MYICIDIYIYICLVIKPIIYIYLRKEVLPFVPAQVGDICFAPVLPKEAGGLPVWAVVVCKFEQHALIKTCTWHTQWWIKRSIYIPSPIVP
jgi:hypothetical protein